MSRSVTVRNLQRVRKVDSRMLRDMATVLLDELLRIESYEISIVLLGRKKMADLNEQFLHHAGSTDVITFPYPADGIRGDIAVCVPEAVMQAKAFGTSWQAEIVRYIVHGVLHLLGYDDRTSAQRRRMKKREDELVLAFQRSTKRRRR